MELSDLAAQMRAADPDIEQKMDLYFLLMDMGRIEEAHRIRATTFGDDGYGPLDTQPTIEENPF